jgi:putative cell wall-binding protein
MFGLKSQHITAVEGIWSVVDVDRWAGADRYETAVAVSQANFGPETDTVFIATGTNFPDALVAAPFAEAENASLLLVRSDAVTAPTRGELVRLNPDRIVILGGTGVVSNAVEADLANYGTVERVAGPDRYATATEISKAAFPSGASVVYIATGVDFDDALSIAPVAAMNNGPVLLTRPLSIVSVTRQELQRLSPDRIVVVGAGSSIAQSVVDELASYATVESISGAGAVARSVAASAYGFPGGADVAFLATVDTFPDALAAGPVAALLGGPLLLTDPSSLSGATADELRRLDPSRVVILGGPGAIATSVEVEVRLALQ